MSNFLGRDGYVYWVGVVENIEDPLKIGRCKIRIFGWHTENLSLLPTNELPWATPASASNGSGSFSVPKPGDYVSGYFFDVNSAQNPYYTAVLPGVQAAPPDTSKGFSPQSKLKPATPPEGQKQYTPGQPTLAPLARGVIANTAISQSNSSLSHVCDISAGMKLEIVKLSLSVNNLMNTLRTEAEALWASSSGSPFGNQVKVAIEKIGRAHV